MPQHTGIKAMRAVVVIALLLLVGVALSAWAQGPNDRVLQHVIDVQERHTPLLMATPGVVGTAVGHNREGLLAVKVFVETGADAANMPRNLDGIPVAIQVTGQIVALHHRAGHGGGLDGGNNDPPPPPAGCDSTTGRARPACIGMSTGHPAITAGTIGCRVKDAIGYVYALSNNHVYADSNAASIGDNVLQPGPYDGGMNPDDAIGTLADFELIEFCDPYPSNCPDNTIDAAIALSSTGNLGNATPSDGYGTPVSSMIAPDLNMKVKKYGRTTLQTKGTITGLNATVNVNYGPTGIARFVGQIIISGDFSAGGDSGSLIVVDGKGRNNADDRKPVGLLFAGGINITVANPIDAVLDRFDVTVDGAL